MFEAAVDGLPTAIAKGRNLLFDIQGDGNLPRVSVIRPTSVTKKGSPLLLFNRLLTNRCQTLPMVLKNEGTLPCKVNITLIDPECCYTVMKEIKAVSIKESNGMPKYHISANAFFLSTKPDLSSLVSLASVRVKYSSLLRPS